MRTIFVKELYSDDYNFNWFKDKNFDVKIIYDENDYTFINQIKQNDILFLQFNQYDEIIKRLNKNISVIIFLYIGHEWIHKYLRKHILKNNTNNIIYFITLHIDNTTIENDLPIECKCFTFHKIIGNKELSLPLIRNKKYNIFNRHVNLMRLKIFEILKKQNFNFTGYYTFANILFIDSNEPDQYTPIAPIGIKGVRNYLRKSNRNKVPKTIREYVQFKKNRDFEIDIDYIESKESEFVLLGNIENFKNRNKDDIFLQTKAGDLINQYSLDSYISFIVESGDDETADLRISEKTIRAWLCKNIILPIQCPKFSNSLRNLGVKTFDDIFGLEEGWDDEKSDIIRIETFISALNKINEMSLEEVEELYNRKDVQDRLEHNYIIAKKSFNENFVYQQIYDKIMLQEKKKFI
jgi:hypothetical protein